MFLQRSSKSNPIENTCLFPKVSESYPGQPGCIVLNENPLLILGGDGFTHSNFDGCVRSAESIVREMEKALEKM